MYNIVSLLFALIPCLIYMFKNKNSKQYILLSLLYIFYIYLVYSLTGMGTVSDIIYSIERNTNIIKASINLAPLTGITTGFYLNIIMFMPLGFLLPLIYSKYQKPQNTIIFGFLFSLFIELSQLITFRATDIDDIIANTLGSLLGYIIWKIYMKLFKKSLNKTNNKDAYLYIFISYLSLTILSLFEKNILGG